LPEFMPRRSPDFRSFFLRVWDKFFCIKIKI
jgi:hypothetical protein